MRYMTLWRPGKHATPPTPELDAQMGQLISEMTRAGVMVATGGWDPGSPATLVRSSGGKLTVTDGPFAEAKEAIGGFALVEVKSREEALMWTRRFLELVGEGTSELRELGEAPPLR